MSSSLVHKKGALPLMDEIISFKFNVGTIFRRKNSIPSCPTIHIKS